MVNKTVSTSASAPATATARDVGAFQSAAAQRKYWVLLLLLLAAGGVFAAGLLAWDNPMGFGTRGFWLIAERRADAVIAMAVVAICQATATVAFHTVTNNHILTPSIMGFEACLLYTSPSPRDS